MAIKHARLQHYLAQVPAALEAAEAAASAAATAAAAAMKDKVRAGIRESFKPVSLIWHFPIGNSLFSRSSCLRNACICRELLRVCDAEQLKASRDAAQASRLAALRPTDLPERDEMTIHSAGGMPLSAICIAVIE